MPHCDLAVIDRTESMQIVPLHPVDQDVSLSSDIFVPHSDHAVIDRTDTTQIVPLPSVDQPCNVAINANPKPHFDHIDVAMNMLSAAELRKKCLSLKIPSYGTKLEMICRIRSFMSIKRR